MVNKIMVFMTIHLIATVTRPTVLGKWKKAQETDKYIALWVQYIILVCTVYTYCYKFKRSFAK